MPSLKWPRKKLLRKEKKRTALIRNRDLFPLLAADRPSILTPSTSSEHLVTFDSYGLFQRLSYEIRRSILIEASGERTLHMDLEFDHPLARKSGPQTDIRHCDLDVNLTQNTNIRKGWQWFGCVCHWPFESMLRTLGPGREFSIAVPILTWNMIECKHCVLHGSRLSVTSMDQMAGFGRSLTLVMSWATGFAAVIRRIHRYSGGCVQNAA